MKKLIFLIFAMAAALPVFAANMTQLTATTDPGVGSILWVVDPNLAHPQDRKITIPDLRTEMGLSTLAAAETLWSVSNLLVENDIDTGTELLALYDDETGTGVPVFNIAPTINGSTLTGVHDAGGASSFELPNAAAPTTDAAGEIALDTTITDHKPLLQYYNGTANMYVPAILAADLPTTDNHALVYDATNDKFVFEAQAGGGGSTSWDNIADAAASGVIAFAGFTNQITSTLDGAIVLSLHNTDADNAGDTTLLRLGFNDASDANSIFLDMVNDEDGAPTSLYKFTATAMTVTPAATFGALSASSFTGTGTTADSLIALPDDDETHFFSIQAADTTTTSVNLIGPAAPFSGIPKYAVSGTTNFTMSQATAGTDILNSTTEAAALILPNEATDAALATAGEIRINTTDEQVSFHSAADGEISGEASLSLIYHRTWIFDPDAVCDGAVDRLFLMTIGDDLPEGMIIDEWKVSFEADPTTEADLDLKYADAFIGVANAAVIDVLDTTAGVSSEDTDANINSGAAVANGKVLYLEFGTAYTESNHQIIFELWYHAEED